MDLFKTFSGDMNCIGDGPQLPELAKIKRRKLLSGAERKSISDEPATRPRTSYELQQGCYFTRWVPPTANPRITFVGTTRIETHSEGVTASADLYSHLNWRIESNETPIRTFFPEPEPSTDVPVFPREDYAFYLRITEILESSSASRTFTLRFERYIYGVTGRETWSYGDEFRAEMSFDENAPEGYPPGSTFLHGDVFHESGTWVGVLTMGWISGFLRKAILEIDRSPESESPLDNGAGVTWKSVFEDVGWDLTVDESDADLVEPSGESWSMAELHATMLDRRDSADLDNEWRYHLLCVRELDATSRGIMYDAYESDFNNNPREGAAISTHWVFPNDTVWGEAAGERFGASTQAYFRTAIHEIGHAMGLYHNSADNGFMNATNAIAFSPGVFPHNIKWSFNPADAHRLRHFPDPWVRPGMMRFGHRYRVVPVSPVDEKIISKMVSLDVKAHLPVVPLGAPVRVKVTLRNTSNAVVMAPTSLSLKSGNVDGYVESPSRNSRAFMPTVLCVDQDLAKPLEPGKEISNDLTLIRGQKDSLFTETGAHTIVVKARWEEDGTVQQVTGRGEVMITPPRSDEHAEAALKIISTPDILQTIAIGGDHLEGGLAALKIAMADEVLAPHYGVIEAKRLARPFLERKGDHNAAKEVLRKDTVMSSDERKRIKSLLGEKSGNGSLING